MSLLRNRLFLAALAVSALAVHLLRTGYKIRN